MATVSDISLYDTVEILEPSNAVPAGATGAVLEFHDDGKVALVEFTSMPEDRALDRIEVVPLSNLRLVKPSGSSSDRR